MQDGQNFFKDSFIKMSQCVTKILKFSVLKLSFMKVYLSNMYLGCTWIKKMVEWFK